MRKLCKNYDREDGLETVLEVPMPEEMFCSGNHKNGTWQNLKSSFLWPPPPETNNLSALFGGRDAEIQMLLGVAGAPLIPLPICPDRDQELDHPISKFIKNQSIEAAMAKYIVKQYMAATGGEAVLNSIESMYAMGKIKMGVTGFCSRESINRRMKKTIVKMKNNGGEMGGFVMWKKGLGLWSLELVVSGCKISAGSDGNVAWRQTPWHAHSHASRGPSRPLRRFFQGLDPRSTACLFARSVCVGEKTVNDEECFVLKLETQKSALKARSSGHIEMMKHIIWGCFSQRTGLLVRLDDTQILRIKDSPDQADTFWETTTETLIHDYRTVDGVQIAHKGKTRISLFRYGESSENHSKTRMEEVWEIEEVGFNVKGLSLDCFMPPSDLRMKEDDEEEEKTEEGGITAGNYTSVLPLKVSIGSLKPKSFKVNTDEENVGELGHSR